MSELSFDEICDRLEIPPQLRKHIVHTAPARGRMAAARGILPAPPRVLLSMQYVLVGDPDKAVAAAAEKSLVEMPPNIIEGLLNLKTHSKILEFLAFKRTGDEMLMERVALLRQVNDRTLCYLAENGTERIAELISQNQERLIIHPQILRFLRRNPNSLGSTLERVVSFLRLHGIEVDEPTPEEILESERAQRTERPRTPEEPAPTQAVPSSVPPTSSPRSITRGHALPDDFKPGEFYTPDLPEEPYVPPPGLTNPLAKLFEDWGIPLSPSFVAPPPGTDVAGPPLMTQVAESSTPPQTPNAPVPPPATTAPLTADLTGLTSLSEAEFAFGFEEDDESFDPYLVQEDETADSAEEVRGNVKKLISGLKMGDKIKLAYKGNKTVREVLIRDTNKVVACAVVKSGRLTENEVVAIASNRAVAEDVIRELARVKENLRMYPVKVALCTNPKTPVPVAMRLISSLHVGDLKSLARNRNVSSAVFTAATKLYKQRQSSRGG